MVLDLLTNPDAFFAERSDDPSLLRPALVVLIVAVIGVIGSYPVIQATISALPPEAGAFVTVIQVVGAVFGVVVSFIIWVLYAVAFRGIAYILFDGDGSFRDTFALVGWGFVPAVFGGLANAAVNFVVFSGVQFPDDPAQVAQFAQELQSRPEFLVAGVLGIAFLLWSAFLWTFAVRYAEGLDLREAALTVAGPVAVALLIRLNGVFGVI
jgi:hypothetical protein